jgi:hypothetical protein
MFITTSRQDELPDIPILTFNEFYDTFQFGTIGIKYEPHSLLLNTIAYPLGEHLNLKLVDSLKDCYVAIAGTILDCPNLP